MLDDFTNHKTIPTAKVLLYDHNYFKIWALDVAKSYLMPQLG